MYTPFVGFLFVACCLGFNLQPAEEAAFLYWVNVQVRNFPWDLNTSLCTWQGITCVSGNATGHPYDGIASISVGQDEQGQMIYGELPDLLAWESLKNNGTGFTFLTNILFDAYRWGPYMPDYAARMWTTYNDSVVAPGSPWNLNIMNNGATGVLCPMPEPWDQWSYVRPRYIGCTNINIIQIVPTFGPRTGGTLVTVHVNAPLGFVDLRCSFGGIGPYADNLTDPVPVTEMYFMDYYWHDYDISPYHNDTTQFNQVSAVTTVVRCRSPPHPAGAVDFRIVAHLTTGEVVLLTQNNVSVYFSYECPAGTETIVENGVIQCNQCPAGTWSQGATTSCIPCPAGSFSSTNGSSSCTLCPSGTFGNISSQTLLELCYPCNPGTYADTPGHSACDQCAPGTAQPSSGQTSCTQCLSGFVAPSYGNSQCTACTKGLYALSATQPCFECPVGTFSTSSASTTCTNCQPGTTTSGLGKSECDVTCQPGTYRSFDIQRCVACPPGRYSNGTGLVVCSLCPQNYYNPDYNQSNCEPCPDGTLNTQRGATRCFPKPVPPPTTNQIGLIIGIILLILVLIGIIIAIIIIIKKRREHLKKQNEIEEIRTIMEGLKGST